MSLYIKTHTLAANFFTEITRPQLNEKNKKKKPKLLYKIFSGNTLIFQEGNLQVSLANKCLTAVFGMGTGVSTSLSSPEMFCVLF